MRVKMAIDGKRKTFMVHKLVAEKFLPQRPTDYHEIRHIDGDRRNNNASNLSWGTRKENAQDREKHGKTSRGDKHSAAIKASLVNVVNWRKKRRLEREANARLIASAPELLEALKQTEKVFNVEEIDPMQAFIMIEKIRGIIAKAEGRA